MDIHPHFDFQYETYGLSSFVGILWCPTRCNASRQYFFANFASVKEGNKIAASVYFHWVVGSSFRSCSGPVVWMKWSYLPPPPSFSAFSHGCANLGQAVAADGDIYVKLVDGCTQQCLISSQPTNAATNTLKWWPLPFKKRVPGYVSPWAGRNYPTIMERRGR